MLAHMLARLSLDLFAGRLIAERQPIDGQSQQAKAIVMDCMKVGRARATVSGFAKGIDRLSEALRGDGAASALGQSGPFSGNVVGRPMVPNACWRIGIIAEEDEAAGSRRCICPFQWRRHILAVAGKATWDRSSTAKAA